MRTRAIHMITMRPLTAVSITTINNSPHSFQWILCVAGISHVRVARTWPETELISGVMSAITTWLQYSCSIRVLSACLPITPDPPRARTFISTPSFLINTSPTPRMGKKGARVPFIVGCFFCQAKRE